MTKRITIDSAKRLYNSVIRRHTFELDELIVKILKSCPEFINEVPRQTPDYIKLALSIDGTTIDFLREEPSYEYMKLAVETSPSAIVYITDPPKDLIKKALKKSPLLIGFFEDLDTEMKVYGYTSYYQNMVASGVDSEKIKSCLKKYAKGINLKLNKSHYKVLFE